MDSWVTLGAMYKDGAESPYSGFRSTLGMWGDVERFGVPF